MDWTAILLAVVNLAQVALLAWLGRQQGKQNRLLNGHLEATRSAAYEAGQRGDGQSLSQ